MMSEIQLFRNREAAGWGRYTTPTRRSALGLSTAAIVAGFTAPVLASAISPNPDSELIDLCTELVSVEAEIYLLTGHDEHAPDFGPNNARYEQLKSDCDRLVELIGECQSATSPAAHAAVARAALTWVSLDHEGNVQCDNFGEELMVKLAEGVSPGFVWPPRPGSC
jgi:hypothetical protein